MHKLLDIGLSKFTLGNTELKYSTNSDLNRLRNRCIRHVMDSLLSLAMFNYNHDDLSVVEATLIYV